MFVSVVLDPGGIDSARLLVSVLVHAEFKKIQRACWECMNVTESDLASLKKEIDRVTDYYDTVRIYQFPLDGMFVITELKQKRWKRCQMRSESSNSTQKSSNHSSNNRVGSSRIGISRDGISRDGISRDVSSRTGNSRARLTKSKNSTSNRTSSSRSVRGAMHKQ